MGQSFGWREELHCEVEDGMGSATKAEDICFSAFDVMSNVF